jgi:hypothetical protein
MNRNKQIPESEHVTPNESTPEEQDEEMNSYLEKLYNAEAFIFCLEAFSQYFSEWSAMIDEAMSEMIAKKQKMDIPCNKEQNALGRIKSLLALLSDDKNVISELKQTISDKLELAEMLCGHEQDINTNYLSKKMSYFKEFLPFVENMAEYKENFKKQQEQEKS